jgi:ribosomal protein S17
MKRILISVVAVLLACGIALAHGKEQHIVGTVAAMTDDSITVQTNAKEPVTVYTMPSTKFEKSDAAASMKNLKIGDRVVIHAAKMNDKLMATEVRFGAVHQTPH